MHRDPHLLTTSANRNLLQPTKDNRERRRSELRQSISKGKERSTSRSSEDSTGAVESKLRKDLQHDDDDPKIDESQLVDLIIEDTDAEEAERVRARKEGGDAWNKSTQKHFVRTYSFEGDGPGESIGDDFREGYDPSKITADHPPPEHAISEDEEDEDDRPEGSGLKGNGRYASMLEDDNVWK